MRIIIHIPDDEANMQVEGDDENIRPVYREVMRRIESMLKDRQIRYTEIKAQFRER